MPAMRPALPRGACRPGSYARFVSRFVLSRELGRGPQRWHNCVGHRDRTQVPGIGNPPGHDLGRTGDVPAGTIFSPWRAMQSVLDSDPHQLVVLRQVLNLIDASTE